MATAETHYTLPLPSFDKPVKLLVVVAPYYKDIADNPDAKIGAPGGGTTSESLFETVIAPLVNAPRPSAFVF